MRNNTHISTINSHIEDFLDYYCNLKTAPQFAILLKGEWGCGKSWFINKYIEKRKRYKIKPLYVSLYGINSFSQIEESLFEQIHPVLGSKGMKIAGMLFKSLLKGTLKIDLTKDGKDDGTWSFSVPELKNDKNFKINDSNFSILIFDDLERCSLDIENILGYIHSFVESGTLKVIIISNEDEIKDREKYSRIKEKLIGKTFQIHSDIEAAFAAFVQQIENENIRQVLIDNIQTIKQVYEQSHSKNLRILNQITLDFEIIFNSLPEKVKQKREIIEEILELLTVFSIEISRGQLNPRNISEIQELMEKKTIKSVKDVFVKRGNSSNNLSQNQTIENIDIECEWVETFKKYGYFDWRANLNQKYPNLSWWQAFFDKGIVDKKQLEELLISSKYFIDENTPNWIKLKSYEGTNDQEFNTLLNSVISDYENKRITDCITIYKITKLFLQYSEIGCLNKNKGDIIQEAKDYINYLEKNNKLDYQSILLITDMFSQDERFKKECQELIDHIKISKQQARQNNIKDEVDQLIKTISTDVFKFKSMICINSEKGFLEQNDFTYYDFPIFKYVDPQKILDQILVLQKRQDLNYTFHAIEERYNTTNDKLNKLIDELDFLKDFQKTLLAEINNRQGRYTSALLKSYNEQYLQISIEKLENYKKNLKG